MESLNQVKQLIIQAKNVCLIPGEEEPESAACALALFYTLRDLDKNVNLLIEKLPEKLNYLIPSPDFASLPRNLVISIPRTIADVSQIYYEKNEESLKIHLTTDGRQVKKENVSFYFAEPKPDVVIALGINDFRKEMENRLDSFGYLLDSPVVKIGGRSNVSGSIEANSAESPVAQEVYSVIKSLGENFPSKNAADCLLAALMISSKNFKEAEQNGKTFEAAADLLKRGADYRFVSENFFAPNL